MGVRNIESHAAKCFYYILLMKLESVNNALKDDSWLVERLRETKRCGSRNINIYLEKLIHASPKINEFRKWNSLGAHCNFELNFCRMKFG